MKLVQTSILSSLSTFVKIFTGFIAVKIIALYLGPKGVAVLGQFTTFVNILAVIAGGGVGLGIIKYVAEYSYCNERLKNFLTSSIFYTGICSFLTLIFGILFSKYLSIFVLGSEQYAYLIKWLAIIQVFISLNLFICATINGLKKISTLVAINISSSIVSLILISTASIFFGIHGSLFGIIVSQGLSGFIALAYIYKNSWFISLRKINIKFFNIVDKIHDIKNLSRYSFMNVISTITVPMSQIIVRKNILVLFGWTYVGYWQAVIRISDAYLLFITTALSAYYLPKLSELKNITAIKNEIWQAYKFVLPLIFMILATVYIFRDLVIMLLYNSNFRASRNLFLFQLIGDFFRTAGWLSTYLLLAKSKMKTYISSEILLSVFFVVASRLIIPNFGVIGATYSFALTYFLYWVLMVCITIIYFKSEKI